MPARADIDPADLKYLLPYLLVTEIGEALFRVRHRLIGTQIAEHAGVDFTGRYLHELQFGADSPSVEAYRVVVDGKSTVFGFGHLRFDDPDIPDIEYQFCILPLSEDGARVTHCVSLEDYPPLKLARRALLRRTKILPASPRQ